MNISDHEWFMDLALDQARNAYKHHEVPVGAILISPDGEVLSKQFNLKETSHQASAHAEILCINEASKKIQNWRLADCTLYVTLEPCPMCFSAILQARLKLCVFGAYDKKGGALSLGYRFHEDERLNHRFNVIGGIRHKESSKILSDFFKERRTTYKNKN